MRVYLVRFGDVGYHDLAFNSRKQAFEYMKKRNGVHYKHSTQFGDYYTDKEIPNTFEDSFYIDLYEIYKGEEKEI